VALDCILEVGAMSTNETGRIVRRFDELRRHWIAGRPQLHRLVVDRKRGAQDGAGGVAGVSVGADRF
jgi:hypothetical protein